MRVVACQERLRVLSRRMRVRSAGRLRWRRENAGDYHWSRPPALLQARRFVANHLPCTRIIPFSAHSRPVVSHRLRRSPRPDIDKLHLGPFAAWIPFVGAISLRTTRIAKRGCFPTRAKASPLMNTKPVGINHMPLGNHCCYSVKLCLESYIYL